jgi:hypothetical protein
MENLQIDLNRLGEWAFENEMIMKARVAEQLNYLLWSIVIPEMSSCKHLGILGIDLSWADRVNYAVKKAWKTLHFTMQILKKGNSITKSLAYTSLACLIHEYEAVC